jgi:hypothetical protein
MTLSKERLLAVAQEYWDSSQDFLLKQEASPERRRLQALWDQKLENMEPWNAFLGGLRNELPDYVVGSTLTTADASLRCVIYPPKESRPPSSCWIVVGCVSILAPVYILYGVECEYVGGRLRNHKASLVQVPPGMDFPARVVARRIETTFGYSAVPREIAETPVPLFIEFKEPPETTLFHALFTSEPSSIP